MAANYGVIAWKVQGGQPLNPEEMEVCRLSKLIIKDATIPRPGVTVNLQFMQTLWEGTILSIHGMNNYHLHPLHKNTHCQFNALYKESRMVQSIIP